MLTKIGLQTTHVSEMTRFYLLFTSRFIALNNDVVNEVRILR